MLSIPLSAPSLSVMPLLLIDVGAVSSIALNVAEGGYSQGNNERARYFNAMGSARETRACLEVAQRMRYVRHGDQTTMKKLDEIDAILFSITR